MAFSRPSYRKVPFQDPLIPTFCILETPIPKNNIFKTSFPIPNKLTFITLPIFKCNSPKPIEKIDLPIKKVTPIYLKYVSQK